MGGLLGIAHGFSQPAYSAQVVPNFTRGVVTAETTSTQTIVESIHQIEYATGDSYTVTGTSINFTGTPQVGTGYIMAVPSDPFQFSESYLGAGIATETFVERTTTTESFTTSVSVFTQ